MKKLVLLTLALLCLCLCTSCNDSVSVKSDSSICFTAGVNKYLTQTNSGCPDLVNAENYYWEFSSLLYTDEISDIRTAIINAHYSPLYPDPDSYNDKQQLTKLKKGLGNSIYGFKRNSEYIFGLRGYSDPELTQLVWEGYTYEPQLLNKKENKIVLFMSPVVGEGNLFFDISVPGNLQDKDKIRFYYSYVGKKLVPSVLEENYYPDFSPADYEVLIPETPTDATPDNTSDTNCIFRYKYGNSPDATLPAGVYFFMIKEVVEDNDGVWIDFPGVKASEQNKPIRSQFVIVNILPDTNTYVTGNLDEFVITELEPQQFDVSFSFPEISLEELTLTTATTTYTDIEYTLISANKSDKIEWMINGSYIIDENTPNRYIMPLFEASDSTFSYLLWDPNLVDDNKILFFRAEGDTNIYTLTCLYNKDSKSALAKSISL